MRCWLTTKRRLAITISAAEPAIAKTTTTETINGSTIVNPERLRTACRCHGAIARILGFGCGGRREGEELVFMEHIVEIWGPTAVMFN
jgi:hypothetical protein